MVVNIKGIKKLNSNIFEQINISEDINNNEYLIRVFGDGCSFNCNYVGNVFSEQLKGMSAEEKVIQVIRRYLENFKINGITSLIGSAHRKGKWIYIYGNNNSRVLRLQLFNSKFDEIFNIINSKYLNDRYEFFWNEDIKKIKLSLDTKKSSYNIVHRNEDITFKTYVNYSVKSFKNDGIFLNEKLFITELLNHKFWKIGEEVQVENIIIGNDNNISGHIIRCGDFELSFPHNDAFMFIFDIVNNYNNELFEIKMNDKKRQLKMEGF